VSAAIASPRPLRTMCYRARLPRNLLRPSQTGADSLMQSVAAESQAGREVDSRIFIPREEHR
jgi:hypothetical protein